MNKLKEIYRHEQFHPGFLGLFINPFYFARKGLDQYITSLAPFIKGKILGIGCRQKPYKKYFIFSEYIGFEIDYYDLYVTF